MRLLDMIIINNLNYITQDRFAVPVELANYFPVKLSV